MKPSAIFMNIGRGTTVNEADLCEALETKTIAGACLDVYSVEPLDAASPLWDMPNVMMYPHCADQDMGQRGRAWQSYEENVKRMCEGRELTNLCDKRLGY